MLLIVIIIVFKSSLQMEIKVCGSVWQPWFWSWTALLATWNYNRHCRSGLVYVSERDNHRVLVFTSGVVFVSSFESEGNSIDQFNIPLGLAFNREGLLYVCDTSNYRLVVY